MIKNIYMVIVVCISMLPCMQAATWNVFLYMDASDNLCDMAFKNITDILKGNPNNTVNVHIQLHAYNNQALRYHVHNTSLMFVEEVQLSGNAKQDFVEAASWAFNQPSDYTMLIFSNHGWGVLNPQWNDVTETWEAAELSVSNKGDYVCTSSLPLKTMDYVAHQNHKGYMFNGCSHTYLKTQELAEGLAYVKEHYLYHKNIDIVAFDTCMGSMLEIATCIAPYAQYLLGVQSCAMRDGFDYQQSIALLNEAPSPAEACNGWVTAFDTYYALYDNSETYTCSALDLTKVHNVNNALNTLVTQLLSSSVYTPLLKQVRDETPRFCIWPVYADLITFCKGVEQALQSTEASSDYGDVFHTVQNAVEEMVIARCSGSRACSKAHGFSIYLPFQTVDTSYYDSAFAQQSTWITLLQALCN